ncbi:endonuclease/exonuclease/phosphatase family protein [Bifidobacterium sp. ESL0800]|uniref:endonuclease/exonuclease/phosphatase family protein n=1 Tax=Bifidobacterium sp. ESL0800 TaxID=2983236 RepID=UPI0023F7AA65|nr:endonuclease/exonuclease/phosphatase family protein [Bifidobacterium sp. ESL0800]WEV75154.1 endonuclease/exonuclease/phosphatase family protein [Bifidobacterium sp. ESL0800]
MSIALSVLLVIVSLWWALRFLPAGADGHGPLPYLIAFVRFLWIPSVIILAAALALQHWAVAVCAAIVTLLTGLFASPWYRVKNHYFARQIQARTQEQSQSQEQSQQHEPLEHPNGDGSFTVMTLNCRYGLADPQAIVDAIRGNDVSVLALQELTQDLVSALDKAGINELLPYRQLGRAQKSDNGGFNGIFSAAKPSAQTERTVDIAAADVPCCAIEGVTVYSAHPKSPMRGCSQWAKGIINLATLTSQTSSDSAYTPLDTSNGESLANSQMHRAKTAEQTDSPQPGPQSETARKPETVIMGDLNSNIDHPSFRELLDAGLCDAGLAASHAHAASFPQWLVWPRLELDHILTTSGIQSSQVRTLAIPGSDHFALLAQLRRI